jgi:hypothetical protein
MPENAFAEAGLQMIRGFALNICAKPALGKKQLKNAAAYPRMPLPGRIKRAPKD